MTGPPARPRWQALEIGPGGVPPESVRPRGGDQPTGRTSPPVPPSRPDPNALPPAWQQWSAAGALPETPRRRVLHGPVRKMVAGLAALAVLVGLALWSNAVRPLTGRAAQVAVGDCLSATGRQIDGSVPCGDPAADFLVVGRYPDTGDAGECSASPADLAVVQSGPTLLCLNFVATAQDCLQLGRQSGQVGKVDCGSGVAGEYRVLAVISNSIDPQRCPSTTTRTLVHRYNSEVLCLRRS